MHLKRGQACTELAWHVTARVDQSTRLQLNEEPRARKGNAATMICVDAMGDEADTRCVRCLRDVKQLHSVRERRA